MPVSSESHATTKTALQEYTRYAKYARYSPKHKRRETWEEQVDRVFDMHTSFMAAKGCLDEMKPHIDNAKRYVMDQYVLGSQRALQFGGIPILTKHARMFNCSATYCDRPRFFQEAMWMLLCGTGVGFSVQKHHVDYLPEIQPLTGKKTTYTVADSIEGWSDAVGALVNSYMRSDKQFERVYGRPVQFDFSKVRPKGASVSWGGKAPGPAGLETALTNAEAIFAGAVGRKLRPIEAYDIMMHLSDAVLSGGVRRSATICLFSFDDEEMLNAKTGDWYYKNPQRGRSNNSVVLVRNQVTKEQFKNIMKSVESFGEPGFVWTDNTEQLYNPCVEIGLFGYWKDDGSQRWKDEAAAAYRVHPEYGISGWQVCNLCEINVAKCTNPALFLDTCKAAAIIGTMQAAYDYLEYLGYVSHKIIAEEALLGVSMTGMMDNPDVAFSVELQREGATRIREVNAEIAKLIGINPSARVTCVKPAGTTSLLLGTSSGIHPAHARNYIRRIQANDLEFPANHYRKINPLSVEKSVWNPNGTDLIVAFPVEVSPAAQLKRDFNAVALLSLVQRTQQNWVEYGTNKERCVVPWVRHNVSNTITIKPDEWDSVGDYIYENRQWFAGISLLQSSGDKDYPQAPFMEILMPSELIAKYGDGAMFASGLIVDGLHAFGGNLWQACDAALGIFTIPEDESGFRAKVDWVRRVKQYADRYIGGNLRDATYLLKDVSNYKLWCDLKRTHRTIDWSAVEEQSFEVELNTTGAQACAGGKCEL